jgi:hypothetical protein
MSKFHHNRVLVHVFCSVTVYSLSEDPEFDFLHIGNAFSYNIQCVIRKRKRRENQ